MDYEVTLGEIMRRLDDLTSEVKQINTNIGETYVRRDVYSSDSARLQQAMETITDRVEKMELNAALFHSFMEYMEENFDRLFGREKHKEFGRCLIQKIKDNLLVTDFNRRDILNEIAAETGIQRGLITKHLSKVVSQFSTFKDYYEKWGKKPEFEQKLFLTENDKEYIKTHYQHYSKKFGLQGMARILGVEYEVVREWVSQRETLRH